MKYFDKVKLVKEREKYKNDKIALGEIGIIWLPEIRDNKFYIRFDTEDEYNWYKYSMINIKDLELIQDGGITDEQILNSLPKNDPKWWCKVEDGYIINLLGERKNKVPYDYNS